MERRKLALVVEALLFATQEDLSAEQIAAAVRQSAKEQREVGMQHEWVDELCRVRVNEVVEVLGQLVEEYAHLNRAFTIVERASGWRLVASPEYAEWCRALFPAKRSQRLTQAALETLSIIAYRQPITKAMIEGIRGVAVDSMIHQLSERGFVKIQGRSDLPGRPMLYVTTELFLEHFHIKSVDELPNSRELRRVVIAEEQVKKNEEVGVMGELALEDEKVANLEGVDEVTEENDG
jgi:segregation and condensation protein B